MNSFLWAFDMNNIYEHIENYLKYWIDGQFHINDYVGMSVSISRCGETVLSRNYGYADVENNIELSHSHIFRIASHSKTFTAIAILQLVQDNRLKLDDKVSDHLEYFAGDEITIKDLLSHGAGISRDMVDSGFWTFEKSFPSKELLEEFFAKDVNVIESGKIFKYSNCGFGLLGQIIEKISGESYADYINQNIITPCDLKNTYVDYNDLMQNLANGYSYKSITGKKEAFNHVQTYALASATGFCSNPDDLCKFYSKLNYGNDLLLSDDMKHLAFAPIHKIPKDRRSYGLGFVCSALKDVYGHTGSFMGFDSHSYFNPINGVAVSAVINEMKGSAGGLVASIFEIINFFLENESKIINSSLREYNGAFSNLWGREYWLGVEDEIVVFDLDSDNDLKNLPLRKMISKDKFKILNCNGFSSYGEVETIERDGSGEILAVCASCRAMKI